MDVNQQYAWGDPYIIQQVGDLCIRMHAAEAVLDPAADTIGATLTAPNEESVVATSMAVAEARILATEVASLAANRLFELAGTRSTLEEPNLDRHWRNACIHILHDPACWKYHAIDNYQLSGVRPPRHAWFQESFRALGADSTTGITRHLPRLGRQRVTPGLLLPERLQVAIAGRRMEIR